MSMTAFRASRDVIIRAENFQEANRFYESILGLPRFHDGESLTGFETGTFRLYVENGGKYPRDAANHGPVFDFLVSDIQAAKSALLAAGCALLEEDASVPRCYFRDPFGLVFNIEQS
jgi:catechol 2,3-dioxygenase-like lactoylglutathione lyase family enzyme